MYMEQKIEIKQLLEKPVWQMSGEEFCQLTMYANSSCQAGGNTASKEYAYGIHELGTIIGCCDSTIYSLKKQGVLDDAIVSQIGKKIIFDVEKARRLAGEFQQRQRTSRSESVIETFAENGL